MVVWRWTCLSLWSVACRTTIPQSSAVSQVQGETVDGDEETRVATAPKVVNTKTVKEPKSRLKSVTDKAPVKESTQSKEIGVDKLVEIDEDSKVLDPDTMYEAQCLLKQRQRKGRRRQFLVKWADQSSTDSWCDENDVSEALLAHWFITHNQNGLKKKKLNIALINVSSSWARRRWWEKETPESVERVDQFGNEL